MRRIFLLLLAVFLAVPTWAADGESPIDQLLMSGDPATISQGVKAFQALTEKDKRQVVENLADSLEAGPDVALRVAKGLAALGPQAKRAIPNLVEALRYDEEDIYKEVAIALKQMGSDCLPYLGKVFRDSNFFVRRRAAEIVSSFGSEAKPYIPGLFDLWREINYDVHIAAEKAIIQLGPAALPGLTQLFRSQSPERKKEMLALFGKIGRPALPFLIDTLRRDSNSYLRSAAATELGNIHPTSPEAVSALVRAVDDGEEWVRVEAVQALGSLGPSASVALGKILLKTQDENDPLVRSRAQDSVPLMRPPTPEALQGLLLAFQYGTNEVRRDVVRILSTSSISVAQATAIASLASKDSDADVQSLFKEWKAKAAPPVAPAAPATGTSSSAAAASSASSTDNSSSVVPSRENAPE